MGRKTVAQCQAEWMATRYAVDMMDLAWSLDPEDLNFHPEVGPARKIEFIEHRDTLLNMQNAVLLEKYALEEAQHAEDR